MTHDLAATARAILDTNAYMTIGTADPTGRPWISPVWFAAREYTQFFWVSSPDALHSRNLAARPEVSIVVFDSRVPLGAGQAVYMSALAAELTGIDLERGIGIFSAGSQAQGGREWTEMDVRSPAPHRLYRATVSEHWVLDPAVRPDRRTPVTLTSSG